MVKLTHNNGSVHGVLDTWNSIRSSLEEGDCRGNPLFLSTTDRQSIPFNLEICCSLSLYLSRLVKGTFENGCCCSNQDVVISLPEEVSSKTVYDLKALMIGGTISGMDRQGVKELKYLFNILGFKSIIMKGESNDNDGIIVAHEFRIDDTNEEEWGGDGGDGGRNDEENSEKDDRDRSIGIETGGGEVVNEAREIDNDGGNVVNDKLATKVTSQVFPSTTGTTNETYVEAENTNSYEELGGESTEKDGNTPLEYSRPAQNDEEHAKNDEAVSEENEDKNEAGETGDNDEAVSDENEDKNEAVEIVDNEAENHEKYMNCDVKLKKLKKSVIEDGGMGIKTRLRKKKNSIKRASRSDSDDSDVSFDMEGINTVRKMPKRAKKKRSYRMYSSSDDSDF